MQVVPIINKVAADDSNVQIRYLANKALYLLKKGFQIREPAMQIKTHRQKSHINLDSLEKYLWHSKPAYRLKAVQGATKFGDKRALPLLMKRLEIEDDREVKPYFISGSRDEKIRIINIIVASKNVSNTPLLEEFLASEADETSKASLIAALAIRGCCPLPEPGSEGIARV